MGKTTAIWDYRKCLAQGFNRILPLCYVNTRHHFFLFLPPNHDPLTPSPLPAPGTPRALKRYSARSAYSSKWYIKILPHSVPEMGRRGSGMIRMVVRWRWLAGRKERYIKNKSKKNNSPWINFVVIISAWPISLSMRMIPFKYNTFVCTIQPGYGRDKNYLDQF